MPCLGSGMRRWNNACTCHLREGSRVKRILGKVFSGSSELQTRRSEVMPGNTSAPAIGGTRWQCCPPLTGSAPCQHSHCCGKPRCTPASGTAAVGQGSSGHAGPPRSQARGLDALCCPAWACDRVCDQRVGMEDAHLLSIPAPLHM